MGIKKCISCIHFDKRRWYCAENDRDVTAHNGCNAHLSITDYYNMER